MTTSIASDEPAPLRVGGALLLICMLALSLRAYHTWAAVVVSPDSALLIAYARQLAAEPLAALRQYAQHPLYPGLILLFHQPVGWLAGDAAAGWIFAGQLAAIAGSLSAVLALYWLAAQLYERRCGLLAAVLLAVLPDACRYGADVLTDLPHLAFYLVGLAALLAGMRTGHWRYLLLAGAAAALAFLARPEGASVLLVGLLVLGLHRSWPLKRRLGRAGAMVGVFLCLAAPYQLATGKLIQKKSPLELFKFGLATRVETQESMPASLEPVTAQPGPTATSPRLAATLPVPVNILRQWARAGRVVYVLLAIVGVIVARPRGVGGRVIGAAIGVHLLLLYALESRYEYLDRRHALILATLSLPFTAQGVWWLAGKLSAARTGGRGAAPGGIVVAIVIVCVAATSRWLLRPINAGEEHVVASAGWLASHTAPDALIVGDSRLRRVALYADRAFVEWRWWGGNVKRLAECLEKKHAAYFVVDVRHMTLPERNPAFFEQLERHLGDRLRLLHAEPAPSHARRPTEIRVYRYED